MVRIIILLFFALPLFAQQQLSVQQAVELGLQNNNAVKNAELDVKFAKKQVLETIAIGLPKVNGEVNWQNFLETLLC